MALEAQLSRNQLPSTSKSNPLFAYRRRDDVDALLGKRRDGIYFDRRYEAATTVQLNRQGSVQMQSSVRRSRIGLIEMILLNGRLGNRALERLEDLAELPSGWDSGRGAALSQESVSNLINLLYHHRVELPADPRLFLSNEGGVRLVWSHSEGRQSILICQPTGYTFVDSDDNEIDYGLDQLDQLANALNFPS